MPGHLTVRRQPVAKKKTMPGARRAGWCSERSLSLAHHGRRAASLDSVGVRAARHAYLCVDRGFPPRIKSRACVRVNGRFGFWRRYFFSGDLGVAVSWRFFLVVSW